MPDYALAQIYTLTSKTDESFIYVGSTCRELSEVLTKKVCDYKAGRYKKNVLFKKVAGNWDDIHLQLLEQYPCENLQQLREREQEIAKEKGAFNCKKQKA